MIKKDALEHYLDALLKGDRGQCRLIIEQIMQTGVPANLVYIDVIWPMMIEIEKLFRVDRISSTAEHMATRINRTIVDQLQNKLPRRADRDKKIAICCTQDELQELGAQIMADMFESDGWEVKFLGGGLTNDDILTFTNEYGPDILLIYGTGPKQAPEIRRLIDTIKDINAHPDMRIMASGGLFNRAEGLWQEMGADLFAATAEEAVQVALGDTPVDDADKRTINRRKRKRQKQLKTKEK